MQLHLLVVYNSVFCVLRVLVAFHLAFHDSYSNYRHPTVFCILCVPQLLFFVRSVVLFTRSPRRGGGREGVPQAGRCMLICLQGPSHLMSRARATHGKYTTQHGAVQYSMAWCGTVQYGNDAVWYGAVLMTRGAVQFAVLLSPYQ